MTTSPAVDAAKKSKNGDETIVTLKTGDRVRIKPVSISLIDSVTSGIKDPSVPMWMNPDKGREEPNPNDPNYLNALEDANRKRGMAGFDAMIMFGVELIDGLPEKSQWLSKLKMMGKLGHIDLTGYDLEDEVELEFLYKRYIAVDASILAKVSEVSGITAEDVKSQEDSFRGNS